MITADAQSTAKTTPGTRYLLGINNVSGSTVNPTYSGAAVGINIVPENSTTSFTVATTTFKWITFYAVSTGIEINSTDGGVSWILVKTVDPSIP
jgi:hypothetical protein